MCLSGPGESIKRNAKKYFHLVLIDLIGKPVVFSAKMGRQILLALVVSALLQIGSPELLWKWDFIEFEDLPRPGKYTSAVGECLQIKD